MRSGVCSFRHELKLKREWENQELSITYLGPRSTKLPGGCIFVPSRCEEPFISKRRFNRFFLDCLTPFQIHESPGISVFPAKHEVLQLMTNSAKGWNTPACRHLVAFCLFFWRVEKSWKRCSLSTCLTGNLTGWLVSWLFDWELDWLTGKLTGWLVSWLVDCRDWVQAT